MNLSGPRLKHVALYVRVSTTRQAEGELSIPDQIKQGQDYCAARGWTPVEIFIEPGATATDDRRPEFQRMIEAAVGRDRPFDVILVHSMSRFFRDQIQSELYIRKLNKAGVEVISATQEFADGPTGVMLRQIIGAVDQHFSAENAKHTLRAMQENARQGFWNGSKPPFGYKTVEVEKRGQRIKKILAIDEAEAPIVREIYDLALGRHGAQLGVKAIVNAMNAKGWRSRGKPFHISSVYRILTSTTYHGVHYFNQFNTREQIERPKAEWIPLSVPPIIPADEFEQVQASLQSRNPKRTPPRVVSGPTLLTGLARCGTCGSGMTIRTGKSGKYRYYACAGCAQKGKTLCPGRSISMPALDGMVLEHLTDNLFRPERLKIILETYIAQSANADAKRRAQLGQARKALTEASGAVDRLIKLVMNGLVDDNDPDFKANLDAAKHRRQAAAEQVRLLEAARTDSATAITAERLDRFAKVMHNALHSDDPDFRKAYLRLFVDQITVGDEEVHLCGPTAALAKGASSDGEVITGDVVPSFVREWRPVRYSNSCYRRDSRTIVQRSKITAELSAVLKPLKVSVPKQILSVEEPPSAPAAG